MGIPTVLFSNCIIQRNYARICFLFLIGHGNDDVIKTEKGMHGFYEHDDACLS